MKAIKTLGLTLAISSLGLQFSSPAFADKTIRVGSWLPPAHTMNADVLPTWGQWIEEATEGRVKLKIEYPGGNPSALLDQVQDGAYDAAWTFHGFYPGRFKLPQAVELPGIVASAEAASVAHWRVHQDYFAEAGEHEGLEVVGLFTHGPGQIHLTRPIENLTDLRGKKIRIGGGVQTDIAHQMGIEGVAAPGSKVYEILSQGVADGVFMPMIEKKALRLKEVAPFTIKFPNGMYLGSFVIVMSQDFLQSLSTQDREAILSVSGEKLSALAGKHWSMKDEEGEADARESGNTIMDADEEMLAQFAEITKDFDQQWIDSVEDRNINAAAALEKLRSIASNYMSETSQ